MTHPTPTQSAAHVAGRSLFICSGCDSTQEKVVQAVLNGQVACCPDCSVLSVEARNTIRAHAYALADAKKALEEIRKTTTSSMSLMHIQRVADAALANLKGAQ